MFDLFSKEQQEPQNKTHYKALPVSINHSFLKSEQKGRTKTQYFHHSCLAKIHNPVTAIGDCLKPVATRYRGQRQKFIQVPTFCLFHLFIVTNCMNETQRALPVETKQQLLLFKSVFVSQHKKIKPC